MFAPKKVLRSKSLKLVVLWEILEICGNLVLPDNIYILWTYLANGQSDDKILLNKNV